MVDSNSPDLFLGALGCRTKISHSNQPLVGLPASKPEVRLAESAVEEFAVALESKPETYALADEILPPASNRFVTENSSPDRQTEPSGQ